MAYSFLADGEIDRVRSISFAELDRRARTIAVRLLTMAEPGERTLLLYPPGLSFIEAFFGALYAGMIAVPAYPSSRRHLDRLTAVISDATPAVIMTDSEVATRLEAALTTSAMPLNGSNATPCCLNTDELSSDVAEQWHPPQLTPSSLAFLQYTSGSTGDPKGVMVSHGNLMANQAAIQQSFEHSHDSVVVGWLPLYHDMGLIGNILQPLYLGTHAILMSPMAFLEQPIRWLKAISVYQATTSGGPNFAYDLCVRKISPAQKRDLDLSCWRLAFNGSEPVRAGTMERFVEAFGTSGFRRDAFYPCYGLAEATLFVTGTRFYSAAPAQIDGSAVKPSAEAAPVNCGVTPLNHAVRIVHPVSGKPLDDGECGEIVVSGPSVAQGYWNRPQASDSTFRQRSLTVAPKGENSGVACLNTGDLGFITGGQLHITGRIKDLIIIRGRNYYPHDIEQILTDHIASLRPGGCAALAVTRNDEEGLVVVAEVTRNTLHYKIFKPIFAAMRQYLADTMELAATDLVLVQPGVIPKTSSGKLRRNACKKAYLDAALPILASSNPQVGSPCCVNREAIAEPVSTAGHQPEEALNQENTAEQQLLQAALKVLPLTQRETLLARFMRTRASQLLGVDEATLRLDTPLRSLGLDSLKLIELKHTVDQLLGRDAPLALFLSDQPLGTVAAKLAGESEEMDHAKSDQSTAFDRQPSDSTQPRKQADFDLSLPQYAMWTVDQMERDAIGDNLHLALNIAGSVDALLLRQALEYLLQRHALLRTVYRSAQEGPVQSVLSPAQMADGFNQVDATGWVESAVQNDITRQVRKPFDLTSGPIFRTTLYQYDTNRYTLLFCTHHIGIDLWSVLILVDELQTLYAQLAHEQQPTLAQPTADYAVFVAWQQHYIESPASASDWDYWRQQLAGELPVLALPVDHLRPPKPTCHGASVTVKLNRDQTDHLKALARDQGVTLFTLLLAAYKVMLHRYTRQQDLVVGVPTSGRAQARFTSVVGNFVNPLPLRSHPVGDQPFTAFLAAVNDTLLSALEHQHFPFPLMVERLQPERSADHWPIYQTLFVLQQAQAGIDGALAQLALGEGGASWSWGDWQADPLKIEHRVENFDLNLMAAETTEGLLFSFQYRSDLFESATIKRLSLHFTRLMEGIINNPESPLGDLPLLSDQERQQMLMVWNATDSVRPSGAGCALHHLIETQVEKSPDAVAVVYQTRQITYQTLNRRANRLAHALINAGVRSDTPVGLCAHRSLEMVVGLIGILKAGGAYLPLDPDYPQERLNAMLGDAKAPLILAQPAFINAFPGFDGMIWRLDEALTDFTAHPERNPDVQIEGENLAYVLFTSGSTGRPKGVGIPHQGIYNRLLWMQDRYLLDATDAVLQKTPYTFDVSVWEFFWPLISGARLIVCAAGEHKEPQRLVELIELHNVTTLHFVPSMLGAFIEAAEFKRCQSWRRVICSGEALSVDLRDRFFHYSNAELHNLYGPTEGSIDVTAYYCERDNIEASVAIGRPISNTRIYILDSRLNPVPAGVAGELYIGGVQLARGYLNRPDLTARQFVPDPFDDVGERLYKSGDLVRYRPNGVIDYLGRIDHQVKIRGFRIELGEIETRLRQHPSIEQGVVLVREDTPGDSRLVAYLVCQQNAMAQTDELRAWLCHTLPDYMVPAAFITLGQLPVTTNGKLDRNALPAPDFSAALTQRYVAPRNVIEGTLVKIWSEVLRVERVGIHDNFFDLGGDSILSIQAVSRAAQAGYRLAPRQLFQHPTIAALARETEPVMDAKMVAEDVGEDLPLTPIQRWFFHHAWIKPDHWNQALLLEVQRPLEVQRLEQAVSLLVTHHAALRLRFVHEEGRWRQFYAAEEHAQLVWCETLAPASEGEMAQALAHRAASHQAQFDLAQGPLFRVIHFHAGPRRAERLLMIAHHLVVDAVSWRILLEDLEALYQAVTEREDPVHLLRSASFQQWGLRLNDYASTLVTAQPQACNAAAGLPIDYPAASNMEADASTFIVTLEAAATRALVQESSRAYRTHVAELLLAAMAQVISAWANTDTLVLDLEGHGRDHSFDHLDLTRTVGWFTSLFPLTLNLPHTSSSGYLIKAVKEQVRQSTRGGFDHSVRAWLGEEDAVSTCAPILFNYLGHLDPVDDREALFRPLFQPVGGLSDPSNARLYEWEINAAIHTGQLELAWTYSTARYDRTTIKPLAEAVMRRLSTLIEHCLQPQACGLTPVDFPLARLTQQELDALACDPRSVEEIYPLAPMQEGLLFHTLMHPGTGIYLMQDRYGIEGQVDIEAFRAAWKQVIDRHAVLRSAFVWEGLSGPHQIVYRHVAMPFEFFDWRDFDMAEQTSMMETMLRDERERGFDLVRAPLMHIRLVRLSETHYRLIRSHHHILMDAWCTSLILQDFNDCYKAIRQHEHAPELVAPPFKDYIAWLQQQNQTAAEHFWRDYLAGFAEATPLVVDHPQEAPTDGGEVGDEVVFLSTEDTAALNSLAQHHRLTVNTFVQAAWALLISRYSRNEEVLFGVTVAGRPTDLPDIESVIGLFINSLPLRVRIDPQQHVVDFLNALVQQNLDLRHYEYMPLVKIQAMSDIARGQPLFQHLLVFENTPLDPRLREECAGLRLVDVENRTHTNYPITVVVIPGPQLHLQLTYERSRFEDSAIVRMLGHFRCLLEGLIHQPQARIGTLGMLTEPEHQTITQSWNQTEFCTPGTMDLPTLFAAQVSRTPDAVAVARGDHQLTFRALDLRTNYIAHRLIGSGVGPDALVALVDERDIDLLVAILAVFKAGGAYLPLDPTYPVARIGHIIEVSRATLVITGTPFFSPVQEAVNSGDGPSPDVVTLAQLAIGEAGASAPLPRGSAQNLAYVIYTSGSTGTPKGAMVERGGMLNNLHSKVSELDLAPGDVVAQTASQCFDISVWQLLTGLICGARVEILPKAVVQDPSALLQAIADKEVTVLELVPSLIGALLDGPQVPLGPLRWLLPTGEAFPVALCRQWLERYPHVQLLNAYGPAECSDDVSYHRITTPPQDNERRVPIGRPLPNIRLYLLDHTLQPVPVGVSGELCVAGIGVGRGYLGRPELAAEVFVPNPFWRGGEEGGRLYRTGDLACYRPDGTLDYMGRIDHQVKVRGFRIEPGEIEARLLAHPTVKEAIVVVREDSPGNRRLVAYCVTAGQATEPSTSANAAERHEADHGVNEARAPLASDELRAFLHGTLPDYMVPSAFVWLEKMPLNPNGKVDRKQLPIPDFSDLSGDEYVAPRTTTEMQLAQIWADVLHIEKIGIYDNFFGLGGDSILSLQIVSRARQAGLELTPRHLFDHPQIVALAAVAELTDGSLVNQAEQGAVQGDTELTPIQQWFFEHQLHTPDHWNQAVMLQSRQPLDPAQLQAAIHSLIEHHDALRMRYRRQDGFWCQVNLAEESHEVFTVEALHDVTDDALSEVLQQRAEHWQATLDLHAGPLLRVIWFDLGPQRASRLLMVIHHLVVDGVSWRILLEDLHTAYGQLAAGETVLLPAKTTSFQHWSRRLREYADMSPATSHYWHDLASTPITPLPVDKCAGDNIETCTDEITFSLSNQQTEALLRKVPPVYRTRIDDVLLAALAQVVGHWSGLDSILIDLESHGRETLFADADLSRTVGWFTSLYPVRLTVEAKQDPRALLLAIKEQLRAIPNHGIDYGIERYLAQRGPGAMGAAISFNYLGQLDQALPQAALFEPANESTGASFGTDNARLHEWEIVSRIQGGCLHVAWRYSRERYHQSTIEALCQHYLTSLDRLIEHCLLPQAGGCTPSDFPLASLDQAELDSVIDEPRNIEDIYPLGPMQDGLLLHTLMSPHSGIYLMQDRYAIRGRLEIEPFQKAWQQVVDTHTVLRTGFVWDLRSTTHQIVYHKATLPFEMLDWRALSANEQQSKLRKLLSDELEQGFPLDVAPVFRIRLIRLGDERWVFARSHHHVLLDAWCLSLLLVDFLAYYEGWLQGAPLPNKKVTPFRDYIQWLQQQDADAAEHYWRASLQGFSEPTYLSSQCVQKSVNNGVTGVADEIVRLSREDTRTLNELARQHQLTPNTFLQAGWALMMAHYLDRRDLLFGVTVAGRPPEIDGIEEVVGLFINSLPLRLDVDPKATVLGWLKALLAKNLAMRQFEYAPLADIQRWSEASHGQALFDALVVFENVPVDPSLRGQSLALDIQGYETRTHTNYPLTVVLIPGDELHLQITYDRALFDSSTVARILGHYRTSLESLVHHPEARLGELDILPAAERRMILHDWNRTAVDTTLTEGYQALFEACVERTPEAVAAVCGEETITYGELNARANCIAHALMASNVGPEALVALLDERGIDYLSMILGVFKAGAAYLPLDPQYPEARVRQVIELSRPAVVLTRSAYRPEWISPEAQSDALSLPTVLTIEALMVGAWPQHNPPVRSSEYNLAYVIYTSGSTGMPKGVLIHQGGLINNILSKVDVLGLNRDDRIAQTASQCFDISVWQFLTALVCGAQVEIFPDRISRDPEQLLNRVRQCGITILELVPSMMAGMIDAVGEQHPHMTLRWLLPTGEALPAPIASRWMERWPDVALLNAYGPAECSDDVAYHTVVEPSQDESIVPIGRPVQGFRLYILNHFLQPLPVGAVGEICIAGVGVGRGYQGRPDLTAELFTPNPFATEAGERLYRTGDQGRYQVDGTIEFIGRVDHQVKVRGHRIELGEIEARLAQHPQVREAAVVVKAYGAGDKRLVAYIACSNTGLLVDDVGGKPTGASVVSSEELRVLLKQSLPEYMVPTAFVMMQQLPITPNGKVDRKALPDPDFTSQLQTRFVAPRTPTEKRLAAIWAEVLKLEQVGVEDDFFDLGGHSLLATQILSRVRDAFEAELPLRLLFEATTVASLATAVDAALWLEREPSNQLPLDASEYEDFEV